MGHKTKDEQVAAIKEIALRAAEEIARRCDAWLVDQKLEEEDNGKEEN